LACLFTCRRPPVATLSPYTTLFRSGRLEQAQVLPAQADPGGLAEQLGFQAEAGAGAFRQGVQKPEPGVVPGSGVFGTGIAQSDRSEEHTSELQSRENLVCRLRLEKT